MCVYVMTIVMQIHLFMSNFFSATLVV